MAAGIFLPKAEKLAIYYIYDDVIIQLISHSCEKRRKGLMIEVVNDPVFLDSKTSSMFNF